ncbi:hypothetical protein JCM33374_g1410 [Metschnikowia sp. JCM 33374]|nr:hypothetical protein JCM33374_g1410 [Metschnikowia sp. JCM 33374]
MTDTPNLPVKPKKKKRSFLDDDDFFVKKKPRVKSPAKPPDTDGSGSGSGSGSASGSGSTSSPTTVPCLPKQETSASNPPAHDAPSAAILSSEDNSLAYHSADESFVDSDLVVSPSMAGQNQGSCPAKHGLMITQKWPNNNSSSPKTASDSSSGVTVTDVSISNVPATSPLPSGACLEPTQSTVPEQPVGADIIQEDIADGLDSDLKEFFSGLAKKGAEASDEHSRVYSVKVSSRLGLPLEYEKEISGDTTFGQLTDQLRAETLRKYHDPHYWDYGILVWVEGRSELKPFFKPSTLRIPQPGGNAVTKITCLYIPKEHAANFENLYSEFREKPEIVDEFSIGLEDETSVYVLSDDDASSAPAKAPTNTEPEDKSEFFVIGLKGKDNKRIEVEVGPTTEIRSLLRYYMKEKGIKESAGRQGRVVFEDEELDLDALVGDTELEEDFEVQVHI